MKKYIRKSPVILLLIALTFNLLACNNNNLKMSNTQKISSKTELTSNSDLLKIESDTNLENALLYDKSKSLTENIDILNKSLEIKYGKSLSISTMEDYEKAGQADWVLVLDNNRVGIDTATWKFSYDSNSDENKYMEAILSTFTFFCGEEMGDSLWRLTGDLLDGGADETVYGFVHNGSQIEYENGNLAAYELSNNESTMYIWLTPSEY